MSNTPGSSLHSAPGIKDHPVVLSVAFPYAPVGAWAVGGAEVICSQLEADLRSLGFASVVVAHAASAPSGILYGTDIPPGEITDDIRAEVERRQQANIDRALADHPVALVHMHGLDFHRYHLPANIPVVVTLHLPPGWYPEDIWSFPENYHFVAVSNAQLQACPAEARKRITVIENGVPLPPREALRPEGRYALMLARICPEKNLHLGLDAARLAGMGALLGGETFPYPEHQRYFTEQIEPRLTSTCKGHEARDTHRAEAPVARFLGPVAGDQKARLLSRAACLLLPSLAPETSSLVAMEALSAGVPVIGMAVGAVPEIVEHGRTGFLLQPGDNAPERMAALIQQLPAISRSTCRETAEQRFSFERMLHAYAGFYRQFAKPDLPRQSAAEFPQAPAPVLERPPLQTTTLDDEQALTALEPEWRALWTEDSAATPFQHPAWLLPWWKQFGPEGHLHTLVVRNATTSSLVALAPLYLYREPDSGTRKLLFIGVGTTDILDGVWANSVAGTAECLLGALERDRSWNVAYLSQLRPRSPLVEAAESRQSARLSQAEPCSTIDVSLPLPPRIRANVNRYGRRAEQQNVRCELAHTPEEALLSFEHLVRLHGQRWESRGESGVLTDERVLAHHRESIPLLLQAGLLRVFRLTAGDSVLGVLYGLADASHATERRLYLYLVGFDLSFADLSPGTLLLHHAWLHARENGFHKLDLLRGGENYKQLWGAHPEPTLALELS